MSVSLRRVRGGAVILLALFVVAVVGYRFAGRDWLDAVYMVVITISTVGFGEKSLLQPVEQLLTIGVVVFGISAAVFTLGGFIQMTMEGEIERTLQLGRTSRAIERLSHHVILCGYGRIGQILAHQLAAKKQPFVVIDSNPEVIAEAQTHDFLVLLGDATEEAVLEAAGVERARTLVTALPGRRAKRVYYAHGPESESVVADHRPRRATDDRKEADPGRRESRRVAGGDRGAADGGHDHSPLGD